MTKFDSIDWGVEGVEVDFDYLIALVAEELKPLTKTDFLIDRFLEQSDLRIEVDDDAPRVHIELDEGDTIDLSDQNLASEELARIYHSQGLYDEAKEIYTNLFLLYSKKIAYFASQIELLNSVDDDKRV
ncbi:MAG: hypothetical protein R3Y68_03840 [Rikenellaceae bacterium]